MGESWPVTFWACALSARALMTSAGAENCNRECNPGKVTCSIWEDVCFLKCFSYPGMNGAAPLLEINNVSTLRRGFGSPWCPSALPPDAYLWMQHISTSILPRELFDMLVWWSGLIFFYQQISLHFGEALEARDVLQHLHQIHIHGCNIYLRVHKVGQSASVKGGAVQQLLNAV